MSDPQRRLKLYGWLASLGVQVDPDIESKIEEYSKLYREKQFNKYLDKFQLSDVWGKNKGKNYWIIKCGIWKD